MLRRLALTGGAAAGVVLAGWWSAVAPATRVPTTQTIEPKGLAMRFELSADWGINSLISGDNGWEWEAFSPGQTANVRIATQRTSLPFAKIAPLYVHDVQVATKKPVSADPHGLFRATRVTIGGEPAAKITVRGEGIDQVGGVSELTTVDYVLVHGGLLYIIEFDTPQQFARRFLPTIARVAATARFLHVA